VTGGQLNDALGPLGYRIERHIGSGGFAEVYAARHAVLNRSVAIKVFRVPLRDIQARERFHSEVRILAKLDGVKNILRVHDARELADGRSFLVTELCDRSLAELIVDQGGRLPLARVVKYGYGIAVALLEAHHRNVFHGDVTPGNVLLRESGEVVLADFGMAVVREHFLEVKSAGFNPEHAAPETMRDGSINEKTDVYGLGSTLYTWLAGSPPARARAGENSVQHSEQLRSRLPEPRRPAPVPDLVIPMLAVDPADRPTLIHVAETLATLLPGGVAPLPGADNSPGAVENAVTGLRAATSRTLRWIPSMRPPSSLGRVRRRRLLLAGAGCVLMLGGLAGYPLIGRSAEVIPTLPLDGVAASEYTPTCTGCTTGTTYPAQAPPTGATTFMNPFRENGRGPRVPFNARIEVICKVYAPSEPSVDPGYWYLVATAPWNGRYYTPANSYLNGGDGPGGVPDPDVDPTIPDCCPPDRPCVA
jgi:tRNA A-37 threonylcarbamoyl transferase component Bud32